MALRADSPQEIRCALYAVAIRYGNFRDVYVFQAEGPVALFAEKMDMEVIVRFVAVAVAEFVSYAFSGVFKGMDQMGVPENL